MAVKHVVGFSGGIDSQACAGWVLDHFPKEDVILINSDAGGHEHSMTTEHVQWYSDNVHPIIMVTPRLSDLKGVGSRGGKAHERRKEMAEKHGEDGELTFGMLAYIKGIFPSRGTQFCTEFLKLRPQKKVIDSLMVEGHDIIRYIGVRADESQARSKLAERQWDEYHDCELVRPILKWTKKECFDYVKARGEKINQLYSMGFSRVGCAPCIQANKEDIRNWAARSPDMIDKVRQWEKDVGYPFFRPLVPGMQSNWIDDVVQWSRTARGGKQLELPVIEKAAENDSCVSKYGLCE